MIRSICWTRRKSRDVLGRRSKIFHKSFILYVHQRDYSDLYIILLCRRSFVATWMFERLRTLERVNRSKITIQRYQKANYILLLNSNAPRLICSSQFWKLSLKNMSSHRYFATVKPIYYSPLFTFFSVFSWYLWNKPFTLLDYLRFFLHLFRSLGWHTASNPESQKN